MTTDNFLTAKHLSMHYESREALRDISFSVPEGSVTGVIGANGCGKTTLFKVLSGLIQDYQGEVTVCGYHDTWKTKREVCYHPTLPFYQPGMKLGSAVKQRAVLYEHFEEDSARRMLRQFDFDLSAKLGQLSRGRCALALLILSLSMDCRICLLDEPFSGIDIKSRMQMKEVLTDVSAAGRTILIATHEISDFEVLFDDVLLIKEGKTVLHSSTDELREKSGGSIAEIAKELI